jgi:hypothetical protein
MPLKNKDWFRLIFFACWLAFIAGFLAGMLGCTAPVKTRPFTRVSYEEYAAFPKAGKTTTSRTLTALAGPSFSSNKLFTAYIGVGPVVDMDAEEEYTPGAVVQPSILFWLSDEYDSYIFFSSDFTFNEDGQSIFSYLSWEKKW